MSRFVPNDLVSKMPISQVNAAFVLHARAYGESDKIVRFLTDTAGKLTGIAKGAKNSRRRFANCLDTFTRVRVHYRSRAGAGMVFMESCDLLQPAGVLIDPLKFAYGSYLVELVDQFAPEGQPVPELYQLLDDALAQLQGGPATTAFLRTFELHLLVHTGYEPQLTTCAECRSAVHETAFLDPEHGTVLCPACRHTTVSAVAMAGETLLSLETLKRSTIAEARRHPLSGTVAAQAAQLTGYLLALHLARPLRSLRLIAALAR